MKTSELDAVYAEYHSKTLLEFDPLEFVHHFTDPWDQEAVAILSALLAYGNVRQIRGSIQKILATLETLELRPSEFVTFVEKTRKGTRDYTDLLNRFDPLYHRFNRGVDFLVLFELMGRSRKQYGSVGEHFLSGWKREDLTIESALENLIRDWREWLKDSKFQVRASAEYLLTRPSDGSCCKRWCMLLRWLGRKDEMDIGLWTQSSELFSKERQDFLRPEQLVIPLDTHTGRMSQEFGFTQSKTLGWKTALEVTQKLRTLSPKDPLKYDFALCHAGIMKRILKAHAGRTREAKIPGRKKH